MEMPFRPFPYGMVFQGIMKNQLLFCNFSSKPQKSRTFSAEMVLHKRALDVASFACIPHAWGARSTRRVRLQDDEVVWRISLAWQLSEIVWWKRKESDANFSPPKQKLSFHWCLGPIYKDNANKEGSQNY